jgi:serine protease Do
VDAERAKALQLREEAGVEITRIDADSPAAKAGLKEGDTVLEYNGQRVEGIEQFVRLVRETPSGRTVNLKISRGGAVQTISPVIGERKAIAFQGRVDRDRIEREVERVRERIRAIPEIRMHDLPAPVMGWRSGMLGIEGEGVSGQLATFFGVKEGVLVRAVGKDTPAEKAGIKAGDVITKVDGTAVKDSGDIRTALRNAKNTKPLKVGVVRAKAELAVDVTIETPEPGRPQRRAVTVTAPQEFDFEF